MLKNQDAVPEPPLTVSQARVTPSELTQALAAIEARKQAEASCLAGTIPIEQAVSELHLDSTSDEIWAEVKVQRARAAAEQAAWQQETKHREAERQEARRPHEAPPFQVSLPPITGRRFRVPQTRRRGWRGLLAPVLVIGVLMSAGIIPHPWGHHTPAAAPILRPLSSEPDGKTVYADDAALTQISEGKSASQVTISENATGNRWPLLKRDGHVYLHGYIASADSLRPLAGKPLDVYNNDNSGGLEGESTSKITLRVDQTPLQQSGGDDGYSEVTVPNFQPDPLTTLSDWR